MTVTVTLNPALDHLVVVKGLALHDANRTVALQTDAGGKGVNVSRMMAQLGAKTIATGFLGGGAGAAIRHVLKQEGVPHDFVKTSAETRTNINVESGDGPPTTFNALGGPVAAEEWLSLLNLCRDAFKDARMVVLAGSLPQGVPENAYSVLADLAIQAGCFLVLDADGQPLLAGLKPQIGLVKPNLKEAGRLLGRPVPDTEQGAIQAAHEVRDMAHGASVALSRGAKGCVLVCDDGAFVADGVQVTARSTIGSGDSLIAGILAARAKGCDWQESLKWGVSAGAATAMSDGTRIGSKAEFESLYPRAVVRKVT